MTSAVHVFQDLRISQNLPFDRLKRRSFSSDVSVSGVESSTYVLQCFKLNVVNLTYFVMFLSLSFHLCSN